MRGRPLQAWLLVLVGGVTPTASLTPLLPGGTFGSKSFILHSPSCEGPITELQEGNQMVALFSVEQLLGDYPTNRAGQARRRSAMDRTLMSWQLGVSLSFNASVGEPATQPQKLRLPQAHEFRVQTKH